MDDNGLDDRIRLIFDACDDNADGFISVDQLHSALLSSGLGDPDAILKDIEVTEDGMIAFHGFQRAVLELQSQLEAHVHVGNGGDEINLDDLSGEECVDDVLVDITATIEATNASRAERERSVASSKDEGFINDDTMRENLKAEYEGFGEVDGGDFVDAPSTPGRAFGSGYQRKATVRSLQSSQQSSRHSSVEDIVEAVNISALEVSDLELEQAEEITKMAKKVEELNSQLELAETDSRKSVDVYTQLKSVNSKLVERLYHLEEQVREMDSLQTEKAAVVAELRRATSELSKQQTERQRDHDALVLKIQAAESERYAAQRKEKELQGKLQESVADLKKTRKEVTELKAREMELNASMKSESESWSKRVDEAAEREESLHQDVCELEQHISELEALAESQQERPQAQSFEESSREEKLLEHNRVLKQKLEDLEDQNHELRAQFIQQGQMLIEEKQSESLAAEMETASKDEIMAKLKDSSENYRRLRFYTEGLLVTIIDKHPELLERK